MSKIKWFLKTLAYGFAVFIGIAIVFSAVAGWRSDPWPLLFLIVVAVAFIGYRFYEGYSSGVET
jgi:hypothetical protein